MTSLCLPVLSRHLSGVDQGWIPTPCTNDAVPGLVSSSSHYRTADSLIEKLLLPTVPTGKNRIFNQHNLDQHSVHLHTIVILRSEKQHSCNSHYHTVHCETFLSFILGSFHSWFIPSLCTHLSQPQPCSNSDRPCTDPPAVFPFTLSPLLFIILLSSHKSLPLMSALGIPQESTPFYAIKIVRLEHSTALHSDLH